MQNTISNNNFSKELAHYALEYMSSCNDFGQAVHALLEKVALQYKLNHIAILENKSKLSYLAVTYEWYEDGRRPMLNHVISYSEQFEDFFLDRNGLNTFITYEDNIYFPLLDSIKLLLNKENTNSFTCIPLIFKDKKVGLITFESSLEDYKFTDDEFSSFYQLKNILESYYFMLRSYRETAGLLKQVTMYDSITGLYNYDTFIRESESLLRNASEDSVFALFYADIINFKYFNEFYGYSAGDEVLKIFKQSLSTFHQITMLACRIFSDYFVILANVDKHIDEGRLYLAIDSFNKYFSEKVRIQYPDTTLNVAVGMNIITDKHIGIKTYIDNANKARRRAKSVSKRGIIYNETLDHELKRNILISNLADDALRLGEFYFELQPKYHLKSRQVIGAEALVRWKRSDGTLMYPNEFIPVFEQNEFILKLDFYIYGKVCEYLRERIRHGYEIKPISVNVSRVHLRLEEFVNNVIKLVDFHKIPHEYLEFEITESIFLENAKDAQNAMIKFKNAGFKVSMDDFGAGYSSLNLLKNLDFDILKLDKEFLDAGRIHKKEEIVIESIINMAKKMKIVVLCEGVETKEQADLLEELHCDLVQGYYFGKPMSSEKFDSLMSRIEK